MKKLVNIFLKHIWSLLKVWINEIEINAKKTCVSPFRPVNPNFFEKINTFKKKILDGPYFICIVCNCCLYKRSVIDYKEEKYNKFVKGLYSDVK